MQVNEIKQRFNRFEQYVEEAKKACAHDANVPPSLADSIRELDREIRGAHDMVINAQQESDALVECIDRLEEIGDSVKHACRSAANISTDTRDCVLDLHKEISTLKHQLH